MTLDELEVYLRKTRRMFSTYSDFKNKDYVNSYLYGMRVRSRLIAARRNFILSQSEVVENVIMDEEVDVTQKDTDYSMVDGGVNYNLSLDDFFKRPVKIFQTTLTLNNLDFLDDKTFDPWDEWSKNPGVRSKLKNYFYFRGDMKLRFVFNSTRYHYGTVIISNQPFPTNNGVLLALIHNKLNGSNDREDTSAFVNYLSQSPEAVYAKIGVDNNIEMSIPFVSMKPSWIVGDNDPDEVAEGSSFHDFAGATDVMMSYVNEIKVANNDFASDVPVQVYAWVENIKLGPATATKMAVSQSEVTSKSGFDSFRDKVNSNKTLNSLAKAGEDYVDDEYADAGPVTKMASAASNLVGKLGAVPVIGGVATATSSVVKGAAKISRMFGFSKVPDIRGISFVKPMGATNFSAANGYDMVQKLTLDEKQELSVALPGMAPDKDEMAISTMCSKEAFLTTFNWNVTDAPGQSTIFRVPVVPGALNTPLLDGFQCTPLSFASSFFSFWRGDITFRFEVVASQFHRGKLLFFWEPNVLQTNLTNLSASNPQELNLQYAYYMDLEEKRDIEITVGFVSDTSLKPNSFLPLDSGIIQRSARNGFLCVTPFTELTTPSIAGGNDSIQVNVYVKSNNMTFSAPTNQTNSNELSEAEFLQSQSDSKNTSSFQPSPVQVNTGQGVTTEADSIVINKTVSTHENLYRSYIGESVLSMRTLLKRTFPVGLYRFNKTIQSSDHFVMSIFSDMYPQFVTNNSTTVGSSTVPERAFASKFDDNLRNYSHYDRLRRAFLFQKGGMRHKFTFHGDVSQAVVNTTINYRKNSLGTRWQFNGNIIPQETNFVGNPELSAYNNYDLKLSRIVEVEVPFYNNILMVPTNPLYDLPFSYVQDTLPLNIATSLRVVVNYGPANAGDNKIVEHACSASEDFSFHRFQGAPFFNNNEPSVEVFSFEEDNDFDAF